MHFFRSQLGNSTYSEKDTVSSPNGVIGCEHLYTELAIVWTLDDTQISGCIWYINHMHTHILVFSYRLAMQTYRQNGPISLHVDLILWERKDLSSQDSILQPEDYSMNDAFTAHIWKTCAEYVRHQAAVVRNFSIFKQNN